MNILKQKTTFLKNKFFKSKYKIGNISLIIPPNYALPRYQQKFKLYDRFLPFLVKHLKSNGIIIDVGANIGDTTLALIQNCENPIYAIEPSSYFYSFLEKNINSLDFTSRNRIRLFKKLIGSGTINGSLNHTKKGTASINPENLNNISEFISLDSLIEPSTEVNLLKVDTDGFDFDVLLSAKEIIIRDRPILFWENEIIDDFQISGFKQLYQFLAENGYNNVCIFDNFGNIITIENDFKTLENINQYLFSMKKCNCTRTFYYVDVLAFTEKESQVFKPIQEYKEDNIKNSFN